MAELNAALMKSETLVTVSVLARTYQMLKGAAATTTGFYVRTEMFNKTAVELTGDLNGTVQIFGTLQDDPQDVTGANAGVKIGSDITYNNASQIVQISGVYRFIRVVISARTSGSLDAVLHGVTGG